MPSIDKIVDMIICRTLLLSDLNELNFNYFLIFLRICITDRSALICVQYFDFCSIADFITLEN